MAGIYIHIPFCKKACTYCDFHFTTSLRQLDEITAAICKEIRLKKERVKEQIGSIYFGGGTPSFLPTTHLQKIFDTIIECFSISVNAEITIEANPDDLDAHKIAALRQLPINRFSIGIQSFFNEDLLWMNRAHTANEAETCVKRSQDAGFENLSIDLIYGYPLLTDQKWLTNIGTAIELQIPHISAYSLTVEARTALAHAIAKGKQIEPSDEQGAAQFLTLTEQLAKAGFDHYEISNYGLPNRHAVHNTNYWRGIPYLGIGPSAHGFDGTTRYINVANNSQYIAKLKQNSLPETIEELTVTDRFNEYVMTSLRTMWGMDLSKIATDFGANYVNQTIKNSNTFVADGKVTSDGKTLKLTEQGKLFADGIAAALFVVV